MRQNDIDNLRSLAILLLFPFHTARIFDTLEPFYVKGTEASLASGLILFCAPWFMPLLFTLSGISTFLAFEKRTSNEYLQERFWKLLVPFISGVLLLVPIQTYYAEKWHNGYTESYFQQYLLFFSKETNLTGYSGGFTPGHLWFLLYLFILSIIALPFIHCFNTLKKRIGNVPLFYTVLVLASLVCGVLLNRVLSVDGKNLGDFFLLFVAGYFILTNQTVLHLITRYCGILLGIVLALFVVKMNGKDFLPPFLFSLQEKLLSVLCIVTLLGLGRKLLNFRNGMTDYLAKNSFPLYVFHQSWIIMIGYYVLPHFSGSLLPFLVILLGSFVVSLLSCEIGRRFRLTRSLFGIK